MKEQIKWEVKAFDELTLELLYELMKSRVEVFMMEQEIICENDFDDLDKVCHHVIGTYNGRVVAYARILPKGTSYDTVGIGRVIVLKEMRGQGVATCLMERAIDHITKEWKETSIKLSAQEYIIPLYESVGFKCISEIYDDAGIPHKKMMYNL